MCNFPSPVKPLDFNSRPSARGDKAVRKEMKALIISIHAPPRGATDVEYVNYWQIIFQFTPLREGRLFPT